MMKTLCCDISTRKLFHGMLPSLFLPPKLHITDVGLKPRMCYSGRVSGFMIQLPSLFYFTPETGSLLEPNTEMDHYV